MSLLDKASLIVTPNAYKESKLYSVVPNTTLGDMDVVRATTATRVNSSNLIESVAINIPRIDYTNGSCPSLLVEPQRTNLLTYSNDFSNVSWVKQELTVTPNSIISPDGTLNAYKLTPTNVNSPHQLNKLSISASVSNTMSFYAKKGGYDLVECLDGASGFNGSKFNLNTGTFTNQGTGVGSMIFVGNGWYRCIVTVVTTGIRFYINNSSSYIGDGTSGIYLWGTQFETASYPTSYIPTVASSVTRNADSISKTGISSLINSPEGVLYFEGSSIANDGVGKAITLLANTSNFIKLLYSSTLNRVDFVCISAGSVSCNIVKVLTDTTANNKIALKWKNNNFALWVNGVNQGSDTSGNAPLSLSTLSFTNEGGGELFAGKMKNLIVFPSALSDTELAQLTTL